jgi:hypothetical protein
MPYIVTGEPGGNSKTFSSAYSRLNFDYKYPEGLDLKPGSELHDDLRNKIWQRARESRNVMTKRFSSWNEVDKILTTYIPTSQKEKDLKKKDPRKPISIVFPYTYSMLEALLTYMSMAFFQDPMFQYEGVEDDDTVGAMLLELIVRLHCYKTKVPLAIHTAIRDNFAYGVGIGLPGWKRIYGKVPVKSSVIDESGLGTSNQSFVNFVESMIFEGNDLSNIDPYMWLPDPSVSSNNIQDGEFVGWIDRDNYMNLLNEELNDETLFNVKYLREKRDKRSAFSIDPSQRQLKYGGSNDLHRGMTTSTHPIDKINMYVTLIPNEWKLGDGEYPEKWFFTLGADDVIIRCHRANHNHGMYPLAVASSEFDGYSITPMSRLEILYGLQGVLDFLFNSHVENVRKAINDMLIVDPFLVNIKDLEDPNPGKLIRLRRPAWGHGVDKVVQQLAVQDITRANIADSGYITQWMDRIAGADQSMQGMVRLGGPERLTKGEFQGTRGSAISRLQRLAMIIGMQFMQDTGTMFAVHTQQYMSKETYVKVVGRYKDQLRATFGNKASIKVTPYDLAINYDVIVRDGSIPGGNFSEAWMQMFSTIASTPELYQQFDIFRIFTYIAQQLGAKNVEDFRRVANNTNVTTMPDNQVIDQVNKGNLVPAGV